MYTITINSVYANDWKDTFNSKKAAKQAWKTLFKNMNFGEIITLYTPAGKILRQVTR